MVMSPLVKSRNRSCVGKMNLTSNPSGIAPTTVERVPAEHRPIRREPGTPRRRSRGQSLVEFSVSMPFLLMLIAISVDISRMFYSAVVTANAAFDGAYYAILVPTECVSGTLPATNGIYKMVIKEYSYIDPTGSRLTVTCSKANETGSNSTYNSGANTFQTVKVTVSYNYTFIWVDKLLPNIAVARSVQMRVKP